MNTKINVVGSKDTLAVRVGHNIRARMGKEGIELEKIRDSEENKLRELLEVSLNKEICLGTDNIHTRIMMVMLIIRKIRIGEMKKEKKMNKGLK